jgi:hypothetical protein
MLCDGRVSDGERQKGVLSKRARFGYDRLMRARRADPRAPGLTVYEPGGPEFKSLLALQ